jgi:predicted transport protein
VVTDLRLFRQGADGSDVELTGSTVALEVELQRRVEAAMEAMLGIRLVASEYPTGLWHRGRIDSLGLDENGAPVVVEYKKGADSGIVTQASSYLRWLCSAQHEFEALVRERWGAGAVEEVDWRRARAVCIAGEFSWHDRMAVLDGRRRMDLVRYRVFDGGLLSLQLIESGPAASCSRATRPRGREVQAAAGAAGGLEVPADGVPVGLRDLYGELDDALTAWGEVEVEPLRHYIAYRRLVNRAAVIFRPKHGVILVYLRLDPDSVALEEGFTRDMRGVGHLGTGDLEVRIASAEDLDRAGPLIRRAFEAA